MKRLIICILLYTSIAVIGLPAVITVFYSGKTVNENVTVVQPTEENVSENSSGILMKVYNPETEEIVETEFEDYIKGVVGAEMPALFEEEALKAQAVAARTYAVRKINESKAAGTIEEVPYNIGQAYLSKDDLKKRWGKNFSEYYKKVSDAVDSTRNQIMVYNNEPILAVFHSTSSGHTENSENVWNEELPYLKGVESIQDENAPDFETDTTMDTSTVISRLQGKYPDLILTEANLLEQIQIVERTEAGYIIKIQIGNKMLTGKEVRELLGLRSSDFTIRQDGENNITFTTKGYGHGAGMSQYGANFMAKEGSSYDEILNHYYKDIEIKSRVDE